MSVYDTINPDGNYCRKVRLLGSFHPELAVRVGPDAADIDDPLYGNVGGAAEQVVPMSATPLCRVPHNTSFLTK